MNSDEAPRINVNLTDQDRLICSNCNGDTFHHEFKIYKVKSILVGQRAGFVPKPFRFVCSACRTPIGKETKTYAENLIQNTES